MAHFKALLLSSVMFAQVEGFYECKGQFPAACQAAATCWLDAHGECHVFCRGRTEHDCSTSLGCNWDRAHDVCGKLGEPSAEQLVETLGLSPLPGEGGFYKEMFRSTMNVSVAFSSQPYSASSTIYYLLVATNGSSPGVDALHRIRFDEMWTHNQGGPIAMVWLKDSADGQVVVKELGKVEETLSSMRQPELVARRDNATWTSWYGAYTSPGTEWALVSCTVSPGFEFQDFELADRASLLPQFPAAESFVQQLTEPRDFQWVWPSASNHADAVGQQEQFTILP